jgi:hypothetical protein
LVRTRVVGVAGTLRLSNGHSITFGDGRKRQNLPPVSGFNQLSEWRLDHWVAWGGGLLHKAWKEIEPTECNTPDPKPWMPKDLIYSTAAWTQKAMNTCLGRREYEWVPDLKPLGIRRYISKCQVVLQPFSWRDPEWQGRVELVISQNCRFYDSRRERVTADTYKPSYREIASWVNKYTIPINKEDLDTRVFKKVEKAHFDCPTGKAYFRKQDKKQQQLMPNTSIRPCGEKKDGLKVEAEEWIDNDDYVTTAALPESVMSMDWRADDQTEDPETHKIPDPQPQEAPAAMLGHIAVNSEQGMCAQIAQARREERFNASLLAKSSIWRNIKQIPWDSEKLGYHLQPNYQQPKLNNDGGLPKKSLPKWHRNRVELSSKKKAELSAGEPPDFVSSKVLRAALGLKPTTVFTPANMGNAEENFKVISESEWQLWETRLNVEVDDYEREQEVFNHDHPDEYHDEGKPIWRQDRSGNLVGQNFNTVRRTTESRPQRAKELDDTMEEARRRRIDSTLTKEDEITLTTLFGKPVDVAAGELNISEAAVTKRTQRFGRDAIERMSQEEIGEMIGKAVRETYPTDGEEKSGWHILIRMPRCAPYVRYLGDLPEIVSGEVIQKAWTDTFRAERHRLILAKIKKKGLMQNGFTSTNELKDSTKRLIDELSFALHKGFRRGGAYPLYLTFRSRGDDRLVAYHTWSVSPDCPPLPLG